MAMGVDWLELARTTNLTHEMYLAWRTGCVIGLLIPIVGIIGVWLDALLRQAHPLNEQSNTTGGFEPLNEAFAEHDTAKKSLGRKTLVLGLVTQ